MDIIHFQDDPAGRQLALDRARRIAFAVFDADKPEHLLGHELAEMVPELDVEAAVNVATAFAHVAAGLAFGAASAQLRERDDDADEVRRLARLALSAVFDQLSDPGPA